jgi:hypothetical protein
MAGLAVCALCAFLVTLGDLKRPAKRNRAAGAARRLQVVAA